MTEKTDSFTFRTRRSAEKAAEQLRQATGERWHVARDTRDHAKWLAKRSKMKKVRNLMSGKEIEIAEDTPLCCDPSSETYWSM